ncbi:GNAT family N-acetyltransferase [Kitasatospora sp. NBC_00458]|uniref:GNAT family N-acetyltransferase n=1 Tax=Kitasatospora sp. NBC_00458 TaxID=2903568 RepID=UPI002E19AC8D
MSTSPSVPPSPRLEPVTPANIDAALELKVHPDQERFVSPVVKSLAEAYAHGEAAWPRLIVDGDRTVGFVMAFFDVTFHPDRPGDLPRSGLWRLNIAADAQGRGYGRFAVAQVGDEIRRRGGSRVTVTYVPDDDGPGAFYAKLGFRPTGEFSGDQAVAELDLD